MKNAALFLSLFSAAIVTISCDSFRGGLSSTSEIFTYVGSIRDSLGVEVSSANIWVANRDENIYEQKNVDIPQHPSQNGVYKVSVFSNTHPVSDPIEHWECGPLRILIESSGYVTYYDSLTNVVLKTLQQNSNGEWILPTITLQKR